MNIYSPIRLAALLGLACCLTPAGAQSSTTTPRSAATPPASVNSTDPSMPYSGTPGATTSNPSLRADPSMQSTLPADSSSASYAGETRDSWLPHTTGGYVGIAGGQGKLGGDCVLGQTCDDPGGALKVYTGGMINSWLGLELAYIHFGDANRNGGTTKLRGANVSLAAFLPLAPNFKLVGRVGSTYSWTETSVGALVTAPSGDKNGFGASFGGGASFDFNRNWAVTLDWERHRAEFAGGGTKNNDVALLGVRYNF